MTVRYLVLWPTAACDLTCPYCYRRDRRGGRMPVEVADTALDLVAEDVRTTGRPAAWLPTAPGRSAAWHAGWPAAWLPPSRLIV